METKCIGLCVINRGVGPILSKVDTIKKFYVPTKIHDVRRFVGLLNYYRDMRSKHTHTPSTLTKLEYTKVKSKWTDV